MALYTTVTVPKDFYRSTSPIHSSCVPPIKFNPNLTIYYPGTPNIICSALSISVSHPELTEAQQLHWSHLNYHAV